MLHEIWLLRLRALLARAHGDEAAYRDYRDRYRDDGDIAWLRRTYRVGRGDAMTTTGVVCGSCGTEVSATAKFCQRVRCADHAGRTSRRSTSR